MTSIIDHRLQQSILYQLSQNSDPIIRETLLQLNKVTAVYL